MKSFEYQCLDFWRSKPADEVYLWHSPSRCALGQFMATLGDTLRVVNSTTFLDAMGQAHEWPTKLREAAYYDDTGGYTFGAAADRLEKLLAS